MPDAGGSRPLSPKPKRPRKSVRPAAPAHPQRIDGDPVREDVAALRRELAAMQARLDRVASPPPQQPQLTGRLAQKYQHTRRRVLRAVRRREVTLLVTPLHTPHLPRAQRGKQPQLVAQAENPGFRLHPQGGKFPYGWLQLRLALSVTTSEGPIAPAQVRLVTDLGQGFDANMAQSLGRPPAESWAQHSPFVFLPPGIVGLRIDLQGVPAGAKIEVHALALVEVTKQEVALRKVVAAAADTSPRQVFKTGFGWARKLPRLGLRGALEKLDRRLAPPHTSYAAWVHQHDTLRDDDVAAIRAHIAALPRQPTISVLMPVYNPDAQALQAAINSVRAQLYPQWQLCIVDDASTQAHVAPILAAAAAADARICVQRRAKNGHISRASNDALAMATGEFVALLDHDDLLPAHALYMVAHEICAHPTCDIIYSDEDKLDAQGRRYDPYFKSDFDPDLLLGTNVVSHLGVYRTACARQVGGFRPGFEGSQDHDLILRASHAAGAAAVRHIPHVLYHWRAAEGSTATNRTQKPYAQSAATQALADHLQRTDPAAQVVPLAAVGLHRVIYPVPSPAPKVSVLIPTRDRVDLLRQCVASLIEQTDYANLEVIVLDNDSTCPRTRAYLAELAQMPCVQVIAAPGPFNYSAINNLGAAQARGELLCLLNNDIEVIEPGWLREMVSQVLRPNVGAVGARLFYPDGHRLQHAGVVMGLGGIAGHVFAGISLAHADHFSNEQLVRRYSAVTAACLLVSRENWRRVGGLNTELAVAYNDTDFCLRLGALGLQHIYTPFATLLHHESASRGSDATPANIVRFNREQAYMRAHWADVIANDPCYNPNLTLQATNFSLASAPRVPKPWQTYLPGGASLPPKSAHGAQGQM